MSTANPAICAAPPTAWPMAFARASSPRVTMAGRIEPSAAATKGATDGEEGGDDVEHAGVSPGSTTKATQTAARARLPTATRRRRGIASAATPGDDARDHHGDDEGEHEQARVEGLAGRIEDEEDEGEVEAVLGDTGEESGMS